MTSSSDEFSGRLGLIFATIGAAIGTGNIWRFPRMVGANGGGSFLVPWSNLPFFYGPFHWLSLSSLGARSRTGTVGTFRIFNGPKFAWMGLWTAWISTAIGFYYAVVTGWCINYFQSAVRGLGWDVDTTEVWNSFLQASIPGGHVPNSCRANHDGSDMEGREGHREGQCDSDGLFVHPSILSVVPCFRHGSE